jgi:hypothetical protein
VAGGIASPQYAQKLGGDRAPEGSSHIAAQSQPAADVIGPLAHILPPPANHRFPDGSTFVYSAEWRLWNAGTATLRIDNSGAERHVTGTATSTGVVALLYKVQDNFESWFDPHSFCSQRIYKHTEEGLRKRETQIRFDYQRRKSLLEEINRKNGDRKLAEQDIPGCVTDVLSGIYYVGSLPLQTNATYVFPLNDGGKTVDVRATAETREQVKTDAGTFATVRVQIDTRGGLSQRGRLWLWYTDDAQRIPVQMRVRMFWGTLTMKLQRVEKPG